MLDHVDIDRFFAASLTPETWPAVLDGLAGRMKADGITLVAGPAYDSRIVCSESLAEIVADYRVVGAQIDSREARVRPTLGCGFLGDLDHFTPDEIERDPFYLDFLRPRGFGWHAVAQLVDGARPLVLSLKRHWRRGPFTRDELGSLSRALPHLRSAARMAEIALTARRSDWLDRLSDRDIGGILLDGDGRVLTHNDETPLGDGLTIAHRRLAAAFVEDQVALDRAVASATMRHATGDTVPAPFLLRRPSGLSAYVVRVSRVVEPFASGDTKVRAIVSIVDPRRKRLPAADLLAALYQLTPREAAVAIELARGLPLSQVAACLGISTGHARQRLKALFEKTGTNRQSDLTDVIRSLV